VSERVTVTSALPLEVWIGGRARTKGSMRHQGHGRMVEQVAGSKAWRATVVETIVRTLGGSFGPGGPSGWWEPDEGPIAVRKIVYLPRPATGYGATSDWPDYPWAGDEDKYQRNVGDALTDTGVIKDDAQICHWDAWKVWAPSPLSAGVQLTVQSLLAVNVQ